VGDDAGVAEETRIVGGMVDRKRRFGYEDAKNELVGLVVFGRSRCDV